MRERPILFSGPMVRAILEGRKTQTRRLLSPKSFAYKWLEDCDDGETETRGDALAGARAYVADPGNYPPFVAGDRLWVRETWGFSANVSTDYHARFMRERDGSYLVYRADYDDLSAYPRSSGWRPSNHMPRWASRITLEVTSVRVERLQEISEDDAEAEGTPIIASDRDCPPGKVRPLFRILSPYAAHVQPSKEVLFRWEFAAMWDDINGKRAPWASNPWVWVVGFKTIEVRRE